MSDVVLTFWFLWGPLAWMFVLAVTVELASCKSRSWFGWIVAYLFFGPLATICLHILPPPKAESGKWRRGSGQYADEGPRSARTSELHAQADRAPIMTERDWRERPTPKLEEDEYQKRLSELAQKRRS